MKNLFRDEPNFIAGPPEQEWISTVFAGRRALFAAIWLRTADCELFTFDVNAGSFRSRSAKA